MSNTLAPFGPTQISTTPQPYGHFVHSQHDAFSFRLQYAAFHKFCSHLFNLPIHHLAAMLGILLSLPSLEQLQAEDFNSNELVEKFTEALDDQSHRNEILSLTGDIAVLVIECLDQVSEHRSDSCVLNLHHTL